MILSFRQNILYYYSDKNYKIRNYIDKISKTCDNNLRNINKMEILYMKRIKTGFTNPSKGVSRAAFTLAEVLIVIAIIGIVTAIVLPGILDVGEDHIWEKQSNVFGAKMFTALKMMNFKGDLARLESTEQFANNLKKYIRIVKICPNETAYQCFDKKISTGKDNEKPKSIEEMGITTAANLGHEDWNNSNVVGLQFTNGISALVAYNTKNCSPTIVNAAENIWESDIFDCIAMMFDVNANASPNEKGKDIKLVNADGVGSVKKKCLEDGTCVAFVVPTEGVDCSLASNAERCRVHTGTNYYNMSSVCQNSSWGNNSYKNNKVVVAAEMCVENGMRLATVSELSTIVNKLGKEYFAQLAGQYGTNFFVSKGVEDYCRTQFGYNNTWGEIIDKSNNWNKFIPLNADMVGVCVGSDD